MDNEPELTDRVIADLVNKIRISGSLDTALLSLDISPVRFEIWTTGSHPLGPRLKDAVREAVADTKMVREHQLSSYFEKDWRALAWWLEHKYPDEYGRRSSTPPPPERRRGSDFDDMLDFTKTTER